MFPPVPVLIPSTQGAAAPGTVFFPNLDGLRFLAFFLVYLEHAYGMAGMGTLGVSFFFVLSGFLISYLLLMEIDRSGSVDVGAFYVRRVLRIWPLYYAVLTFGFVIYPWLKRAIGLPPQVDTGGPLLYLVFLGNFDALRLAGAGFLNLTWSVAIEEQFYVLWPLLFLVLPTRRLPWMFVGVISVSTAFRALHASEHRVLYFHSLSVISDMAIGGLSAYLARSYSGFVRSFSKIPRTRIVVLYVVLVIFMATSSILGALSRLIAAGLFAFVILEQNYSHNSFFKMSSSRVLSKLGRYTYGLYMLHMIVLLFLTKVMALGDIDSQQPVWRVLIPPLGLLLSVLAARLSFLYWEGPFLRLKSRYSRTSAAQSTAREP